MKCVLGWSPQKQTSRQRFACKWFIWEVIPESTDGGGEVGRGEEEASAGCVLCGSLLRSAGLGGSGGLHAHPEDQEAWIFIFRRPVVTG